MATEKETTKLEYDGALNVGFSKQINVELCEIVLLYNPNTLGC